MAPVRALFVLYDAHCGVCREARAWLERQPRFVPLVFVAAGSDEARARFPALDHASTLRTLTVVSDAGAVYRGARAWIMVLWALRGWRDRALTLGWAPLVPLVGAAVWLVSALRTRSACDGACGVHPLDRPVPLGRLLRARP
ncbi:MAG: DUF393 domain-containing protein [Planctomycetes bacterium]|nr:DUF393 domain-containing protein [Planctomycetota bacterium]